MVDPRKSKRKQQQKHHNDKYRYQQVRTSQKLFLLLLCFFLPRQTKKTSMLPSFTAPHTGQEPRKASQYLHEQTCLQGRKRTHGLREWQLLQLIFLLILFTASSSSCPLSSLSHEPQNDAASSAVWLTKTSRSLTCSSVLFRSVAIASFALANLCHVSLSISAFLKHSWSSIVLIFACAKSSSFRLIKIDAFDSNSLKRTAMSCFLCSCKTSFNLSFCWETERDRQAGKKKKEVQQQRKKNHNINKHFRTSP